ncbi:thioredoxin fold domain-containing protein [Pseudodesulfovibrio cashew]|uniref:Thioredoxin fold domain-containing protein n=1 Tax=Pseudodesulfovibrio cashew TaxID=2678688 RepID=A0A6I6JW06_9BACT|nr:thioredoxin family protein [Pseudodesulfovibrio cashew]QGY41914.1 thioredoxin fold domain-containing protein [Pseudodesulfovibrio cashew]
MAKKIAVFVCCLFLVSMALAATSCMAQEAKPSVSSSDLISGAPQNLPIKGMVTMVEIGAHSCIPCRMMMPIIEELSEEYEGRAAIAFIDVWEHREQAAKYGVNTIPTQIFYDAQGKEQYRHTGFLDKESLVAKLVELGVK